MVKLKRPAPAPPGPAPSSGKAPSTAGGPRDPRWLLMPHARLTPAMTFLLMTGAAAQGRIHGWVASAHAGQYDEPDAEAVWAAHQDYLIAEARLHGFEPYARTRRAPTGAGFTAWREAFLRQHSY